jgi:hypothetical protein
MATATSAFRLTERDRRHLDWLVEETLLSRTDVIRLGLAELRRNPVLCRQIRAQQRAVAFVARLRASHGDHAQLALEVGPDHPHPNPRIDDAPINPFEIRVLVRYENDHAFVDLVDPSDGIGIRNAYWTDANDGKSVRIPLKAVDLYRRFAPAEEPRTYNLDDGRTVVAIPQDDGGVKQLVLDAQGNSSLLPADQRADWFDDDAHDPASTPR